MAETYVDDDSFFTIQDTALYSLTPLRTLRRWIAAGIVVPSRIITDGKGNRLAVGFSLRDVAYTRIVRHLTEQGRGIEEAVEHVAHALARFGSLGPEWAAAHLLASPGPLAYTPLDDVGVTKSIPGTSGAGQIVFQEMLDREVQQLLFGPETVLIPEDLLGTIEMNPKKRDGHPVIRDTNIETAVIFDLLETGGDQAALETYPFLRAEQLVAVRKFHGEYLRHEPGHALTG